MARQIPPGKARQGNASKRILMILIFSLAGAFVVWGIAELYYVVELAPQRPAETQPQRAAPADPQPDRPKPP
ncbi:hypothetical protein NAC44_17160 [Allorhizobium sp. BGMRC 0089]|uniref:hypothetical protein n=1 Tax=Allorhizobium sonneratiae TaxID=2934936 RepID=UPI002034666F|nr:hypothetical protein [Allorhizobium sonneratiae]MCM2294058.1 hypothetical protein [Allorhizobium sonneratiae]